MAFSTDPDALALELSPPGYRQTVPGQTPIGRIQAVLLSDDGATPPSFSWKQRSYDTAGNLVDTVFGLSGSPTNSPARENNNQLPPQYPWEVELTPRTVTQTVGQVFGFDIGCGQAGTGFITGGCDCLPYQPRQWQVTLGNLWGDGCCGQVPGVFDAPPAIPSTFKLNYAAVPGDGRNCIWSKNITHAPADFCVAPPFNQYVNVVLTISGTPWWVQGFAKPFLPPYCQVNVAFTGVNPNPPGLILFMATYSTDPGSLDVGPPVIVTSPPIGELMNNLALRLTNVVGDMCQVAPVSITVHPV